LRDVDEVCRRLNAAFDERSAWFAYLQREPRLENISRDPRVLHRIQAVASRK
jgi:hypothetical protein